MNWLKQLHFSCFLQWRVGNCLIQVWRFFNGYFSSRHNWTLVVPILFLPKFWKFLKNCQAANFIFLKYMCKGGGVRAAIIYFIFPQKPHKFSFAFIPWHANQTFFVLKVQASCFHHFKTDATIRNIVLSSGHKMKFKLQFLFPSIKFRANYFVLVIKIY